MKQLLLAAAALILLFSCKKEESPVPQPEHADWYVLRAPDNRDIKAVHGNIDDTLVITTGFQIYVTTDKGRTWQESNYSARVGLFAFMEKEDTLFVMEGQLGFATTRSDAFGTHPFWFSLDKGLTWAETPGRPGMDTWQIPINYAYSGNGIKFGIDMEQSPEGYLNTLGIVSESGHKISLPARHQLINVYFDQKSRLYVTGSVALCRNGAIFDFCDDTNRSGTVYISKKPVFF